MPDLSTVPRPADQVVAALHPYDRPTGEHTAAATNEIAELVRYLNVITLDDPRTALPDPNTTADVLGALHTACTRLPQLLDQIRDRLLVFAGDPDLATGSSTDEAKALALRAAAHLRPDAAGAGLQQLTSELEQAFRAADRLYLDTTDDDA